MKNYNKKGEELFYIIINLILALAFIFLMLYTKKVNIFYLILSIACLLKTIYHIKILKK